MRRMMALLVAREAGLSGAGMLIAVAVIAALAAITAARLLTLGAAGPPMGGAALAITRFDITAAIVLALLAAIRLTARPAEDHAAGWLYAFVGSGGSRRAYIAALYLAVTISCITAYTVCVVVFPVVVLLMGGGTEAVSRAPAMWLMGSMLIASFAAYGLAAGILLKDSGAALAVAVVTFVLPFAVALPYVLMTDSILPRWARLTIFAYIPPLGLEVSPLLLVRHALYLSVALMLARTFGDRTVGRW